MKILLLDIETAPNLAYVWKFWKENISNGQVVADGYMLCWAAKWLDSKKVEFRSINDKDMHAKLHELMSESDAIVHYNGNSFDIPVINKEFLVKGFAPPSPSRQIDLYRVVKARFRFTSSSLNYVSEQLGLGGKSSHAGFKTWVGCMNDDPKAWRTMRSYNIQDVALLETLYYRLRPWDNRHPNHNLYNGDGCPNCGSADLVRRGVARTQLRTYQRYRCNECGRWCRGKYSTGGAEIQPEL